MKKLFTFSIFCCILGFSTQAVVWPTKVVNVDPDKGTSIGALQTAIAANGSAIYVLKRGGIYLTNGQYSIPATATPIIIKAEAGTGPRPLIQGGVPASGYHSGDNVIRLSGDTKFENIYFTGEDMNGIVHKNTVRVTAGTWFEFNGCMFDKDNAASIRNGVGNCVYIFYNCTFRNQVDYAGLSNGRAWDAREGYKNISLNIRNCTFYNISSRIIRPSTSDFDSIVFVNNTCYNIHEALPLGRALKVVCNNNIFYNCGLGGTTSSLSGILEIDSLGTAADATRKFDLRNNLFYTDQAYKDVMITMGGPNMLFKRSILNNAFKAFLRNNQVTISDTIKNQSIPFTNPAPLIVGYVKYMWENGSPSSFTPAANQRIEAMEDPLNYGDVIAPVKPYDFGYPTTHMAYTAGLKNVPLGDKKYLMSLVGIDVFKVPEVLDVQAYFEHGTPNLNLIFNSSEVNSFDLTIYDLLGRQMANRQILNQRQKIVKVNLPELNNGLYIYRINGKNLNNSTIQATGKIVLQ